MRFLPTYALAVLLASSLSACGSSSNESSKAASDGAASTAMSAKAASDGSAAQTSTSQTSTSSGAAMPNACDVLTPAIAKKMLGPDAVLRRKAQPNPHESQCQWAGKGGVITVMAGDWDFINGPTRPTGALAGIGDEAYVGPMGLVARKGNRGIDVDVITATGEFTGKAADDLEASQMAFEKKLAPLLLANL